MKLFPSFLVTTGCWNLSAVKDMQVQTLPQHLIYLFRLDPSMSLCSKVFKGRVWICLSRFCLPHSCCMWHLTRVRPAQHWYPQGYHHSYWRLDILFSINKCLDDSTGAAGSKSVLNKNPSNLVHRVSSAMFNNGQLAHPLVAAMDGIGKFADYLTW